MHPLPRRGSAILAMVTALAAGSLAPAISTAGTAGQPPAFGTQALLGDLLGGLVGLLGNVLTMTTAELQAALAPLTPTEIGDLLAAADAAQLAKLLGALDLTQLSGALGTLDAVELDSVVDGLGVGQTGDLLAVADATQLTALLGVLTGDQLTGALGGLTSGEIGGLLAGADAAQLTALLGGLDVAQLSGALGTLDATQLDSVVDGLGIGQIGDLLAVADATQLTALLGVLTADQLTGALATLTPAQLTTLLGTLTDTLTPAELTTLLGTLTDTLASAPLGVDTSLLEDLIGEITGVLETVGVIPPTTTPPPTATPPAATVPPGAAKPAPAAKPSIFDLIPKAGGKHTAKLGLARASILGSDRKIDVLAPITTRASGRVKVDLHAAGRHHRFTAPVDSANGRIRFKQSIPRSQARLGTGIMTIDYAGNDATRPQSVRLRAASQPARLSLGRPTLSGDGRLKASGTVSSKARGIVRLEVQYVFLGETKTLKLHAKIAGGKWELNEKLSDTVLIEMMLRTGSVHSYTLFTGYFPERIRGEMRSYQILGDRT